MRSKKYASFLMGCLIALSLLTVACDKRHKPDVTNLDQKADADETVTGNNIPATQGDAGDQVSNNNPTIDLSAGSGSGTTTTTTTTTTTDEESDSSTQSTCNRAYSTRCNSGTTSSTPIPTPTASSSSSGSTVTYGDGLNFFLPTSPAVVRCGSLINRNINGAFCSVNSYTGASQPLGMVMKMKNAYGTSGPLCPKVCVCTGENIEMSGWNCQQLPPAQSYKVLIQGCGSRIKTFYRGTSSETTCAVNKGGGIIAKGTVKGMQLLVGKQSVCEQASCTCKGKVTLNRKYAGWKCTLDNEVESQ